MTTEREQLYSGTRGIIADAVAALNGLMIQAKAQDERQALSHVMSMLMHTGTMLKTAEDMAKEDDR